MNLVKTGRTNTIVLMRAKHKEFEKWFALLELFQSGYAPVKFR
jgi:hypothetical protein